jgi:serine phosphatase RsbU (regulator of sigma subunit)
VDRARSYDEQYEVSHALQRSLLPERLESVENVRVAARYLASNEATDIGGDFYDVVPLGGRRLAVVIGDVEGHDMAATTTMGQLRSALRAYLETHDDPAMVVKLLDRFIERHGGGRMATICLAVLSADTGALTFASAGHPPPLMIGPSRTVTTVRCQPGPPLGLGAIDRTAETVVLGDGHSLLFYTDGLVEDRGGGPDARLGLLIDTLSERPCAGAEELCDAALAIRTAGARTDDDVAVLVVQRVPVDGQGSDE